MGIENKGECLWGEKKCGRALAGINLTKLSSASERELIGSGNKRTMMQG